MLNDLPLPVRTREAWADMEAYAAHFFDAYFKLVGETFRKYDPNHLLLGARFLVANANVESAVAACGKYCDVFSYNYYSRTIDPALLDRIHRLAGKPLLLSEWSFGTAEQGLAGGVVDVRNQVERGNAYRSYVEEAASLPYVIGSQWFSYVDQALTGRFFQHYNGECMNIGLVNVADRPFKEFLAEAMKTNYRIYDVMFGKVKPFVWRPEGAVGERAAKSRKLATTVKLWSGLPVRMWDERQTTCAAADLLDESGTYGSKRKEILDSVSATVILDDYLAWRKDPPGEI